MFGLALAATGNRAALLQLRRQIDRALTNPNAEYPFEEAVYYDVYGQPFEVALKLARRRGEMGEPGPGPDKTAEAIPWANTARRSAEKRDPGAIGPPDREQMGEPR